MLWWTCLLHAKQVTYLWQHHSQYPNYSAPKACLPQLHPPHLHLLLLCRLASVHRFEGSVMFPMKHALLQRMTLELKLLSPSSSFSWAFMSKLYQNSSSHKKNAHAPGVFTTILMVPGCKLHLKSILDNLDTNFLIKICSWDLIKISWGIQKCHTSTYKHITTKSWFC